MSEGINGRRVRRSKSEWLALFQEQRRSGLSQLEFCRAHHISTAAFYNARSRLQRAESAMATESAALKEFLPLMLSEPTDTGGWDIELSLGGDVVLRIRRR